jgi:hypothetical protein
MDVDLKVVNRDVNCAEMQKIPTGSMPFHGALAT